jgi:hypothetical protein
MKKPSLFGAGALLVLALTGFTGCFFGAYKQPAAFFSPEGNSALYGLSEEAAAGRLSFAKPVSLRYVFEPPLAVPPDFSLEAGYRLEAGSGFNLHYQVVLEMISASSPAETTAWELPLDAVFPGLSGFASSFRYAVPAGASPLGELRLSLVIRDEGAERPSTGFGSPMLTIHSLDLVPRWFGYALEGDTLALTPFVFVLPEAPFAPVIDPPAAFRLSVPGGIFFRGGEVHISAGERRFTFTPGPDARDLAVPPAVLGMDCYPLGVYGNTDGRLPGTAFMVEGASPQGISPERAPIPADPGLILVYPKEAWRDDRYEVFRWPSFPRVLIFDIANYRVQERLFKRLAFFVEKRDYRGRLVSDRELEDLHGWNAHDYRAEDLALFFEAARREDFPLLEEERELLGILLQDRVLIRAPTGEIQSGAGAVLSVSQESPGYLRSRFMAHEGFHGIFFVDEEFRQFSLNRWENLDTGAKRFLRSYLDFQRYDTADPYLLVNEFMAYCLQQPVSQAGRYFGENLPRQIDASPWRRSVLPPPEESSTGERSWPSLARTFLREAEAFSAYVSQRWGLAAGSVGSVTPE